jgi:hypothetical protein
MILRGSNMTQEHIFSQISSTGSLYFTKITTLLEIPKSCIYFAIMYYELYEDYELKNNEVLP